MGTETLLLVLLIIFLVAVLPIWPHSRSWGYAPTGVFTVVVVIFLIWVLSGESPFFRQTGQDIQSAVQDAGDDIKEMGRDVGDSIKRTVR
ncbi:MAG: DUF3309 domain-containing protein [Candidatus Omnitrophica bacterium]|nr:DUF3309 domain-containing protein [Candidatus Omnitrophota bacterium]